MPICRKQQTVTNMNGSRTEAVKWKNGRRSCQATLGQIAETFWNILHEGNVPFLFCGKYYLPGGETVQKIFGERERKVRMLARDRYAAPRRIDSGLLILFAAFAQEGAGFHCSVWRYMISY